MFLCLLSPAGALKTGTSAGILPGILLGSLAGASAPTCEQNVPGCHLTCSLGTFYDALIVTVEEISRPSPEGLPAWEVPDPRLSCARLGRGVCLDFNT